MHRSLIVAVSAAALLAACGPKAENNTAADASATPDANPAATIPTPANEAAAPDFVMKASAGDMYEIQAAKDAQAKATSKAVKDFAAMMIKDHTKSTADLMAAIAASGQALTPAAGIPADMQAKLDDMNKMSGADFDKDYIDAQIDAHQMMLDLLTRYAQDGDVPAIKDFAAMTAPVVQMHLDQARMIKDGMK